MKFNKKYIKIDENGVLHPVYDKKYGQESYDICNYGGAIEKFIWNNYNTIQEFSFIKEGYKITIKMSNLVLEKNYHAHESGRKYSIENIYWANHEGGKNDDYYDTISDFLYDNLFYLDEENKIDWVKVLVSDNLAIFEKLG